MTDTRAKVCSACGDTPELRPSGTSFIRHPGPDGEPCKGKPIDPPQPAQPTAQPSEGKCRECGTKGKVLKSGNVSKHTNPQLKAICSQRPGLNAECPQCGQYPKLRKNGQLYTHNDHKLNARCIGSNKTPEEAAAKTVVRKPSRPAPAAPPRQPNPYRAMPLPERSKFKANRLADELKVHGWRPTMKMVGNVAELTLRRGKGSNQEELFITWNGGACVGGDGMITHTYKGRTIAVRNANAVRQRAALTPEQIDKEHNRVATRKVGRVKNLVRKGKPVEKPPLPFDPATATDEEIVKAITGRKVQWLNRISQKDEHAAVRSVAVKPSKNGERTLVLLTDSGQRTIRPEALVAIR